MTTKTARLKNPGDRMAHVRACVCGLQGSAFNSFTLLAQQMLLWKLAILVPAQESRGG